MKFTLIKSKHGVFITNEGNSYLDWQNLLFNGAKPEETEKSRWYKIKGIPKEIERIHPERKNLSHYKLKDGISTNGQFAEVVSIDFFDGDNEGIYGLYEPVYSTLAETRETIQFELNSYDADDYKPIHLDFKPQYDLLNQLITPNVLLGETPCRIEPEESYRIIREFIKQNINPKYAIITSDYNFCFTVKKKIELTSPETEFYNVFKSLRSKKMTQKSRLVRYRDLEIFEMAPAPYQKYTLAPTFVGENERDLKEKIDDFCRKLIDKINEPCQDCPTCKGRGVILNES